ncbi:type II secretion system protein N [Ramlibacter pinisoli]|uniref:type II secretion system protein N n=1 Tax=Ramlibacter sp. CGMCC 1.13660 TaxID=2755558 RepID=UPI00351B61AF
MRRTPSPLSRIPPGPWAWAVAGAALGFALTLVLSMPARWLADSLSEATAGRVRLHDPRGTVWNGSAQLVLAGGAGSNDAAVLPSRLTWTLRPAVTGVRATLRSDCCITTPIAVLARPGWRGAAVRVGDGVSQWPAALLSGLGTPWNTLELDGNLVLRTKDLALRWTEGRFTVAGSAELTAERLGSRLSTLRPMGTYRLTLSGGAVPSLQLATVEGALQLSGSGQWVGDRLRFTGEATAAPERGAALANLLNIIGRPAGTRSIISIG